MAIVSISKPAIREQGHGIGSEIAGGFRNVTDEATKAISQTLEVTGDTVTALGKGARTVTRTAAHTLGSALTLPLHGSFALAKGAKQAIQATAQHAIIDNAKKSIPNIKSPAKAFFTGATFGLSRVAEFVGKFGLNTLKRAPEAIISGLSNTYRDVKTNLSRKKDYIVGSKKGIINRAGDSASQITKGRGYQQPTSHIPTIIPT